MNHWHSRSINYSGSIDYVFGTIIKEYDIEMANISILRYFNKISQDLYQYLFNLDKMNREIFVGNMIAKDPSVFAVIQDGIYKARESFANKTNITMNNTISIKNDAFFIMDPLDSLPPSIEALEGVIFRVKNRYTDYIKFFNKVELYYYLDNINQIEHYDIKGIGDERLALHRDYMLDFICYIVSLLHSGNAKEAIQIIQSFYQKYISMNSELGYYRQFDVESRFRFKNLARISVFEANNVIEKERPYIDPSYNAELIRNLYRIATQIQFL